MSWATKPWIRWRFALAVLSGLAGMSQPAHAKGASRDTASVSSAKKERQAHSKSRGASVKRFAEKYLSVCRDWLVAVREKGRAFRRVVFSPVRWLFEWVCGVLPQPWSAGLRVGVDTIGAYGYFILFLGLMLLFGWRKG